MAVRSSEILGAVGGLAVTTSRGVWVWGKLGLVPDYYCRDWERSHVFLGWSHNLYFFLQQAAKAVNLNRIGSCAPHRGWGRGETVYNSFSSGVFCMVVVLLLVQSKLFKCKF